MPKAYFVFRVRPPDLFKGKTDRMVGAMLAEAGHLWLTYVRDYPPPPPIEGLRGGYLRTGTLARTSTFSVQMRGRAVRFYGPRYAQWVLVTGTGIYGPRRTPITPKRAPFLSFVITHPAHPLYPRRVFARQVRGFEKWPTLERFARDVGDHLRALVGRMIYAIRGY